MQERNTAKMLDEGGLMEGSIDYRTNIGRSERTNAVVEPKLSLQWFVDMDSLAKPALDAKIGDTFLSKIKRIPIIIGWKIFELV
jgi:valyl-tRNA synthetase